MLLYFSAISTLAPRRVRRTFTNSVGNQKGAMLEEPIKEGDSNPPKMAGSSCLIGAKTREEVVERLKNDVYVKEGVWNLDEVKIIPFKSALRKAL